MYSMTMSGTCATHVLAKTKSESCLVKAPAMHASESVLVIGELLCTGVQAKRRETLKERNARNVLMLGIHTTLLLTQFESGVIQTSNRARVWQIWEAREDI